MTVDVTFGIKVQEEDYLTVDWPNIYHDGKNEKHFGIEEDGTSNEWTVFSGTPMRSFSIHGFYGWIRAISQAKRILDLCKPNYPDSNDLEIYQVDKKLLCEIESLPLEGEPYDVDRAIWFKYWSRRAFEEFGENSYIGFS